MLNNKSLRSAYDVKANCCYRFVYRMGTLSLAALLMFFENIRPMPPPGLQFALPHLKTITHTLHHNTTLTCNRPRPLFNLTVTLYSALRLAEVVQKLKMSLSFASICCTAGPKSLSCNKGRQ